MEFYIKKIKNSSLFSNIEENEIKIILNCLLLNIKHYQKNEYIFNIGDKINGLALIVNGSIHLEKEDFLGNKTIISQLCNNEIFGASYYYDNEPIPYNIISKKDTSIMFFNMKKTFNINCPCCNANLKIMDNFLKIILQKNKNINKKLEHISQRTIRNKILSYLSEEALNNGNSFFIQFNRQQLADYLCIDRSALSNELSKMRNEGLIKFNKNYFELNQNFKYLNF